MADDAQSGDWETDFAALDRRHVWHPFTANEPGKAPVPIVAGRGSELIAADGTRYLDCISSWWVNLHGHAHPAIAAAVARQAATLEHVIFADFTHAPAARLAARLSALLPDALTRCFFSDNGSTAVEVALKIAAHFWKNAGSRKRRRIAALEGGYHGDTVGAMSAGRGSGFSDAYAEMLFAVDLLPVPDTWIGDDTAAVREARALDTARDYFAAHGPELAALIVEPLVQGAGGMRMHRPEFLRALAGLAREAGALVVFDEVMTGFGRTGAAFACLGAEVAPDLICLAKGLTGGFLPLAATLCRDEIYDGFAGADLGRMLAHGHSYAANPLGCAAALASLDLLEDGGFGRAAAMKGAHCARLPQLIATLGARAARPRICGTIAAFDVAGDTQGYGAPVGRRIKRAALERGLLIRPLGNVVYLLPPYCMTEDELDRAYSGLAAAIGNL